MLGRLNHFSLAVPYVLAVIASAMSVREQNRPVASLTRSERARRSRRREMQKQSRRRNHR